MNAIDFVIRTGAGTVERGSVGGEGQGFLIDAGIGNDISLNISQSDLRGYDRAADDLLITLADGRVIVLENYFSGTGAGQANSRLFLSANGELNEVSFVEADGGALFAQYGPTETWGKWSPSDELIFVDDPNVTQVAGGYEDYEGEEATMAAALPLLGVGAGTAAIGGAGALLGLPLLIGGNGDGNGGKGGDDWVAPTVDNPDASYEIGGSDDPELVVTGTGTPGAEVVVTIGDDTVTGTVEDDGTWEVIFDGDDFPEDGTYVDVPVVVTDPDGTVTELEGPSFAIDTVAPIIEITEGTVSLGEIVNAEEWQDGVSISGTGEAGAQLTVTIGDYSETVTIGEDGVWSFTFDETIFAEGEYTTAISLTATDSFGNATTVVDSIQVDTVNVLTLDNGPLTGDDLVNAAELAAGVTLTGTTQANATVTVTIEGSVQTVTAGADGSWSVSFTNLPEGTYATTAEIVSVDAAGNATSLSHSFDVDTEQTLTINTGSVAGDGIVNAAEFAGNVTVTGSGEAGATVVVTANGTTLGTATVGADGTWSMEVTASQLSDASGMAPSDEGYSVTLEATSTDLANNVTTTSGVVTVDTSTTVLGFFDDGDMIINASERADGVVLTGVGEADATVTVTVGGTTLTTVVAADGSWSVDVPTAAIPEGETTLTANVSVTDLAGNTGATSMSIAVDTQASISMASTVAGDNIINATERAGGVELSGTVEAGSTVVVNVNGTDYAATVSGTTWTLALSASNIPEGETTLNVTATATDIAGNTAAASGTVAVDTTLALGGAFEDADGTVNAAERADGVVLSGTAEAGASLSIAVGGVTLATTAGADGSWSINIPAGLVPQGETTLNAAVTATDLAGNVVSETISIDVDTQTAVTMNTAGVETDGVVNAAERLDGVFLTGTAEAGSSVVVTVNGNDYVATVSGTTWMVTLPVSEIPEGETVLPISATSTDAAGNAATTSGTIAIDTETNVAVMTANVEGDGVVNAAERSDGVVLQGTAEPGATVMVSMGSVTRAATVASDGSWTANFAASDVPTGERSVTITAVATDAAGNVETASDTIAVDTLVRNFGITSTPGGADGVINAQEATAGLTLTGTTEPGGAVQLTLNGHTVTASVAADGSWTATFSAAQLPSGEVTTTLTAVSTDLAGNTETLTQNVVIDTDAGRLTISAAPVEGDDVVNFAEASDGVVLTGTSDPGRWVDVTMNGVTHTVLTDATGTWVAPFAASEIAPGTYDAAITATITDSAGNTLTRTDSVRIDTEVLNFATSTDPVEGDNVVNADERLDGFSLTGTTEPGASVVVTIGGVSHTATVTADGSWSVDFTAADIPEGESAASAIVDTTDAAGNTATTTVNFGIDTLVNELSMAGGVTGDGVVNAAEAQAGITLTGTVEAGSTVVVTLNGVAHTAIVDASGAWSVGIPSSSIPTGTLDIPVSVAATDAAGNTATITESLSIDTDAPDTLSWTGYGRSGGGIAQVWTEATDDALFLGKVDDASGTPEVTEVSLSNTVVAGDDAYLFLNGTVSDGTHLVLASTDAAGNTSGAYLVTDDPLTNEVQMSDDIANALRSFNIDTIDLHFAEDAHLTITADQLEALSSTSDTVAIRGGSDDSVTITGASAQGTHTDADGVTYNVFSLGDATLLIEDDITNVQGVI